MTTINLGQRRRRDSDFVRACGVVIPLSAHAVRAARIGITSLSG
ncbi:hypothetical protein [Burkholderia sp. BCC1630]|nr:hypothetical protein [Burkholderia sp. BCC1630]